MIGLNAYVVWAALLDMDHASGATARQAAAMLRLFRKTGRVDWAAVMEGDKG